MRPRPGWSSSHSRAATTRRPDCSLRAWPPFCWRWSLDLHRRHPQFGVASCASWQCPVGLRPLDAQEVRPRSPAPNRSPPSTAHGTVAAGHRRSSGTTMGSHRPASDRAENCRSARSPDRNRRAPPSTIAFGGAGRPGRGARRDPRHWVSMRRGGRRCRLHGPQRFGQLRLTEGVTEKMLIGALKDLEADRIVVVGTSRRFLLTSNTP